MGKEEAGETVREGGGHASSFPLFSFFISNRGSTCCPISLLFERGQHVFSFRFEWGQCLLPPCLFISFQTEAALAAPVSFLFVLNGWGGSVWDPRCPHFSQF